MVKLHYKGIDISLSENIISQYKVLWLVLGPYWILFSRYLKEEYKEDPDVVITTRSAEEINRVIEERLSKDIADNKWHHDCWLGNINKKLKPQYTHIAKILGATITFYDDPIDFKGNHLTYLSRVECAPEDLDKIPNIMGAFIDSSVYISTKYKEKLKSLGYPVEGLDSDHPIFLGCEKEYWPK